MSLRFTQPPTSSCHTLQGTDPEYAVRDPMRFGLHSVKAQVEQHHPLHHSIKSADALAFQRKLALQRNVYGLHAPIRLQMELHLVSTLKQLQPCFKSNNNLAMDVLLGNDCFIDVNDVLGDQDDQMDMVDFRTELESKLHIN